MIKLGNNDIGKVYLGNNLIGKAYLGNNLVFQNGGVQPVSIPYIRNTDTTAYIDTGITPDDTTRIIICARNWNPYPTAGNWLFCSRIGTNDTMYGMLLPETTNLGGIRVCYGNNSSIFSDKFIYIGGYHKYELNANTLYIDDVQIGTVTASTFSNSYNIHLFGINQSGAHGATATPIDICSCKIYKNNVLVRDYVAVDSPSVGLYDYVSETLFTNAGTGSFTYGSFYLNAYKQLDYIASNNGQYFDSGIRGYYNVPIVCKFRATSSTPRWHSLLGYRISTSSCDISFGTDSSGQDNMRLYWRFGPNNTGATAFNGNASNKLTGKDIIVAKKDASLTVYYNNGSIGTNSKTGVSTSFSTDGNLYVCGLNNGSGSAPTGNYCYYGRIYYLNFGSLMNLIPAKVRNVPGMYDTYNDVFYPSESGTAFVAGNEI